VLADTSQSNGVRRKLTDLEIKKIAALHKKGERIKDIATKVGRHETVVRTALHRAGVLKPKKKATRKKKGRRS
jgi:transposase